MDESTEQKSNQFYLKTLSECPLSFDRKDIELEEALFFPDHLEIYDLDVSGLQASCSVQNVKKARKLANLFVSDAGEILLPRIRLAKELLEKKKYSLSFGNEEERKRDERFLKAFSCLLDSKEAFRLINRMSRPVQNKLAEQVIRDTLLLPQDSVVTDVHTKRAVIQALLTTLRQSLGSCFATAPAILVHENQPLLFLRDIDELMGTAKLKRVVSGNEYSVPMSASSGHGDLKKAFVLSFPFTEETTPIWRSPVLAKVLKFLGFLQEDLPRDKRCEMVRKIVENAFERESSWFLANVEDLLKTLLLQSFSLNEQDLAEYLARPRLMLMTNIVISQPDAPSTKSEKGKKIQKFLISWEEAKRQFKGEADCALLKSWEFTLASFAEVKLDLCRYNFYASLGVNWNDAGGIGQVLYEIANQNVEETNRELEQHKEKFDALSSEITYLDQRAKQANTEAELRWVKMELQSRQTEQYHIQELCNMIAEKANKISRIHHQFLIDQYDLLMREYFQEIYDADLHDVRAGPFDDSPAGFRLIYKYGRSNPSLWSKIQSIDDYVEALVSFFTITEQDLAHSPEIQGIETEFSSIITRLVNHVRSDQFLESALNRTLVAHGFSPIKDPLQHINELEKKPWVFTSGGSLETLVQSYFGLENRPEVTERWVENETELLAFVIDATRLSVNRAGKTRTDALLMHSPTHAFLLPPYINSYEESWGSDMYSYSWISNRIRDPALSFYTSCVLDPSHVDAFCLLVKEKLPLQLQKRFQDALYGMQGFLRPYELKKEIMNIVSRDAVLWKYASEFQEISLDSLLYESVPYTAWDQVPTVIQSVLSSVLEKPISESFIREKLPSLYQPVRMKALLVLMKAIAISFLKEDRFEQDIFYKIIQEMRKRKLMPPAPALFADSNWVKDFFAFVISPGSMQLEFWAVNAYATEGRPITHWKEWLNGSRKDRTWGILSNPVQYRGV